MKKLTFILAILMAINWANAQTLDSIAHHVLGYYGPDGMGQMENAFQMRDGNILFVHKEGINASTTMNVIGHEYYKGTELTLWTPYSSMTAIRPFFYSPKIPTAKTTFV